MLISLIVAMDRNRVIGLEGDLPWHLPADLKAFKKITMGKPIIMGRKTHESIGRPLPGRENIVLTSNRSYQAAGCTVVYSIEEALGVAEDFEEVMVIGGSTVYKSFLPLTGRIYMTLIDAVFDGDVHFPELDLTDWHEVSRKTFKKNNGQPFSYHFVLFERQRFL
jgi:dihydrofolate reductase